MNKKEDIIFAALSLLEETGDISQLNLRKITRRAGCAHTNAYNYFHNFEALKWELLAQALTLLENYMFEKTSTGPDALILISRYISFAIEHPALYKLIWITDLEPDAAPKDTGFLRRIPMRFADSIPMEKADLLHSYIHGKLLNIIFSRLPSENIEEQKKIMLKTCRSMLS